jgi:hypothetical protein
LAKETLQFMLIDVEDGRLTAKAIDDRGLVFDEFELTKPWPGGTP